MMETLEKRSQPDSKKTESLSLDTVLSPSRVSAEEQPSLFSQALHYLEELTTVFGGSTASLDSRRSQAIDSQLEQDWAERRNRSVLLAVGRDVDAVVQSLSLLQFEADRATELNKCKTTGMFRETVLTYGSQTVSVVELFNMTERRKWIHQFDSVTAILFTINLSQFDKVWSNGGCQLRDDVALFDSVANSSSLSSPPAIILLLTHASEFFQKVMASNWSDLFPEYDGAINHEQIYDFVLNLLTGANRTKKALYPFVCDLKDPLCLRHVFKSIEDIREPRVP